MGLILANPPQQTVTRAASRSAVWHAPALLRLWHLASLDAPTVAVAWAWAFAWAAGVALPKWILVLLGLVVWVIYIGDRLLDALPERRNQAPDCLQERHYFHWRYRRFLVPAAGAAAMTALWLAVSRLNGLAIGKDSLVAVAALAYFSGVHTRSEKPGMWSRAAKRLISRECIVGVIFSAGCILPLVSLGALRHLSLFMLAALLGGAVSFALLAWLNVRAIGHWESFESSDRVRKAAWLLATTGTAAAVALASSMPRMAALAVAGATSALLLGVLDRSRVRLTPLALRIAADVVLLAPVLLALERVSRI